MAQHSGCDYRICFLDATSNGFYIACNSYSNVLFAKTLIIKSKFINGYKAMVILNDIPFQTIRWETIPKTEHVGENGIAHWQTVQLPGLRIRIVEYSKGYIANHWCKKGHIVHCLEGEFVSELQTGERVNLTKGMTYVVSDELSSHRSSTLEGVKLLIIDGDFLRLKNVDQV